METPWCTTPEFTVLQTCTFGTWYDNSFHQVQVQGKTKGWSYSYFGCTCGFPFDSHHQWGFKWLIFERDFRATVTPGEVVRVKHRVSEQSNHDEWSNGDNRNEAWTHPGIAQGTREACWVPEPPCSIVLLYPIPHPYRPLSSLGRQNRATHYSSPLCATQQVWVLGINLNILSVIPFLKLSCGAVMQTRLRVVTTALTAGKKGQVEVMMSG